MKIKNSRIVLIIVFLCISNILLSQEKMNSHPDFILIEKLPTSFEILTLKMSLFSPVLSNTISEKEFLTLLDKAKVINPEEFYKWHLAPWYYIEFTTLSGNYKLNLCLGGLGLLTFPNGKRGLVKFNLD